MNQKTGELLVYLALIVFFSYSDLKTRSISNMIYIPIAIFAALNHRIIETSVFFILAVIVGMYDFTQKRFLQDSDQRAFINKRTHTLYRGGDAKLMTLAVAFSPVGYAIVVVSWVFEKSYRFFLKESRLLPYAPFLLASSTIVFACLLCHAKIL